MWKIKGNFFKNIELQSPWTLFFLKWGFQSDFKIPLEEKYALTGSLNSLCNKLKA